jgi:hypothetical protein
MLNPPGDDVAVSQQLELNPLGSIRSNRVRVPSVTHIPNKWADNGRRCGNEQTTLCTEIKYRRRFVKRLGPRAPVAFKGLFGAPLAPNPVSEASGLCRSITLADGTKTILMRWRRRWECCVGTRLSAVGAVVW